MGCEELRALLDAYIDGELPQEQMEEMMAHIDACEACREEFEAAMLLKDCLNHMDDDIAVPLQAQAAWRKAVRAEAKKKVMRKWTRIATAAAAALVLALGVGSLLTEDAPVLQQPQPLTLTAGETEAAAEEEGSAAIEADMIVAGAGSGSVETRMAAANTVQTAAETDLIAADGAGEAAAMTARSVQCDADDSCTARRKYAADDIDSARKSIEMLAAEYNAQCSCEDSGDSILCRVELPSDYMPDFLNALSCVGAELNSETLETEAETAVILIQVDAV